MGEDDPVSAQFPPGPCPKCEGNGDVVRDKDVVAYDKDVVVCDLCKGSGQVGHFVAAAWLSNNHGSYADPHADTPPAFPVVSLGVVDKKDED